MRPFDGAPGMGVFLKSLVCLGKWEGNIALEEMKEQIAVQIERGWNESESENLFLQHFNFINNTLLPF